MYFETDDQLIMKMLETSAREKLYVTNIKITIFLVTIAFFGATGNSLVIYAFSRHLKKGTTNFFILLLAVIDFINCTLVIPSTISLNVWWIATNGITCKLLLLMKTTVVLFSPMILVVIAIDRCLQICFVPGIQIRLRTAATVIAALFCIAVALSVPIGLHTGTILRSRPESSIRTLSKAPCHNDNRLVSRKFFNISQIIHTVVFFLMLITLIVLYTIIFFFICSRNRRWNKRYKRKAARITNPGDDGFMRAARGSRQDKASVSSLVGGQLTTAFEVDRDSPDSAHGACVPNEQEDLVNNIDGSNHWVADPDALELEPITPDEVETKMPFTRDTPDNNGIEICNTYTTSNTNNSNNNINNNGINTTPTKQNQEQLNLKKHDSSIPDYIQGLWRRLRRKRKTLNDRRHKRKKPHIKIAQTLAVVTAAFIISFLPYLLIILHLVMNVNEDFSLEKNILFHFYFINSTVNPIIYSCMNRMFRSEIKKLCRRR